MTLRVKKLLENDKILYKLTILTFFIDFWAQFFS